MFSSYDGLCTIGELAGQTGVSVRTVRFYSDRGLLPEASRSAGGHRRYAPEAVERLRMIRALRGLDLPVAEVRRILDEQDARDVGAGEGSALEDAVAGRLRALGSELAALRWREAALRLVQESPPAERPDRLRLVGAVAAPPSTASLARFWRAWLPPRMPARSVTAFLEAAVPDLPDDPRPAQVLAFARLHAYVTRPCDGRGGRYQPQAHGVAGARASAVLYAGLAEAYDLAGGELRRDAEPGPGEALDAFVDAYASTYGTCDTAAFRHGLAGRLADDPRIDRYWELTAEVISAPDDRPEPTPGSAHDWLLASLETQLGAMDGVDVREGAGSEARSPGSDAPDGARAISPR
ncbi:MULTISPECIES: MerR family transcriptional regulator [Streptomyces]|uniref:MerR-family transcriptional regulator n=1 Tax=Streptomyces griseus subsp. griseus (strain JCM 4626 / CBS 651.72 / NBRC 13350 / KCC S-0626 / ISP 5235) TaxID=455632 RepID=B1VPJ4_STRGG|nr:MerR family transcriptional regulator [Streptomyces griseus]BAG23744.1 putative MerR-family transcriptional regulator [Streptomyces griseus subsp. griseus NBRC 13350]SEE27795.1 DNA-binding transcriptional regulator, MerR family [Streptomyces griseus]SQA27224.1 MerR family transcriptional regulator [Streptomyces griseus]